jgi:diaminopimelate decarboxylase
VRAALRINPEIGAGGHPFIQTGHQAAKFGIAPADAIALWAARARWPHLQLDGVHLHVGSQIVDAAPLEEAREAALALADECARRGVPLGIVNLGGGFGVDYAGGAAEFPLERYAARLIERSAGLGLAWVLEPGRWLAAPVGTLVAEVLAVKRRGAQRFVVLGAGMNDLLRPALYRAEHRIEPLAPRPGAVEGAMVVGPVCESADVFAAALPLPPLEPGDLVAVRDVGAYGASMASNYNGRGRLAELVLSGGRLLRARAGETPADLLARRSHDALRW